MQKIYIRNTIGWHITDRDFSNQLNEALDTGEKIQIMINSPGGSVYMGWAIFNEIRHAIKEGADIETYNIGLAASMASVILTAAEKDKINVAENSMTMIHNPSGMAFGEKDKMKKETEILGKIEDLMSAWYAKVTGTDQGYMRAVMAATTWYKPKEAKLEGLASKIVDGGEEIDKVEVVGMDESAFKGMPSGLNKVLCFAEETPTMKTNQYVDLTKISNAQIREKAWKNYIRY